MAGRCAGPILLGVIAALVFAGALNNLYLWGLAGGLGSEVFRAQHQQWFWIYSGVAAVIAALAVGWARWIATRRQGTTGAGTASPQAGRMGR